MPDLVRLEKKYPTQLVVLGIHTPKFDNEKDPKSILKAMQRYEVHHPVLNDADRKVWMTYGVQSWPTVVLIDPEGYFVGGMPSEHIYDTFDRVIARLVATHRARRTLREKLLPFQKKPPAAGERGASPLFFPGKVLADEAGKRLFIADSTDHRIVITGLDGKKIAVAGIGQPGRDDGPFARATFNDPQGMALGGDTLYVADRKNHLIRALDLKAQTVKTVAGTGRQAAFPPRVKTGAPLEVDLNSPWDLVVHNNLLYIAMAGHHQIWVLGLAQPRLNLFAGSAEENRLDGPRGNACFAQPSGLATDGNLLYVADSEVSAIRSVSLTGLGRVRTLVGVGLFDFGDVDAAGPRARLQHPLGVVYHNRKLYVADTYNSKIKVLDPATNACTTLVGGDRDAPDFNEPGGLSYAAGKLYVADTNAHRIRVVDLKTKEVATLKLQGVEAPKVKGR